MSISHIPNPEQLAQSAGFAGWHVGWHVGWRIGWRIGWITGWWNPFDIVAVTDPREIGRLTQIQGEFQSKLGPLEGEFAAKQGALVQELGRSIAELRPQGKAGGAEKK